MDFEAMMKQMRVRYIADLKLKLKDLETMIEKKDYQSMESFFHKLKGSGASYGLPQYTDYGAKYEMKAKNNELTGDDFQNCLKELKVLLGIR